MEMLVTAALSALIGLAIAGLGYVFGRVHGAGQAAERTIIYLAERGYVRYTVDKDGEMWLHPYTDKSTDN